MRKRQLRTSSILALSVLSALLLIAPLAQSQTETVLYNFTGGSDGAYPEWSLISDRAGNFFGTTYAGGLGYGTIFELSPNGNGGWNEIVLYSFTGAVDGANPSGSLLFDNSGRLYGTASAGGVHGYGVVFELSEVGTSWTESVLHSFAGGMDGKFPIGGVIADSTGHRFYGTTYNGFDVATIFELTQSDGHWRKTVIDRVTTSGAGLTMDAAGNIFSATYSNVFELSPNGRGGWTRTVIYTFTGYPKDGYYADSTPLLDKAGNLYGTTVEGGPDNCGTVYKLIPGANRKWTEQILYSCKGGKSPNSPSGIVLDASGNVYGTTFWGGRNEWGTVFELIAPVGKGSYKEKVLWSFTGTDGLGPYASVIVDGAGNIYGATYKGGNTYKDNYGYGVVFEVIP